MSLCSSVPKNIPSNKNASKNGKKNTKTIWVRMHDYLPPNSNYVVLVGYNAQSEVIESVVVARVNNRKITSIGKVNLMSLDFIGFAAVHPLKQSLLEAFKDTALSHQTDAQYQTALRQFHAQLQQ